MFPSDNRREVLTTEKLVLTAAEREDPITAYPVYFIHYPFHSYPLTYFRVRYVTPYPIALAGLT